MQKKRLYNGRINIDGSLMNISNLSTLFHYGLPSIYKPTRITKTAAIIIDDILANDGKVMKSVILVTDITDQFRTLITTRNNFNNSFVSTKKVTYKKIHSNGILQNFSKSCQMLNGKKCLKTMMQMMMIISLLKQCPRDH